MAPKKGTGWTLGEEPKIRPRWKDVLAIYNRKPTGMEWRLGKTRITDDWEKMRKKLPPIPPKKIEELGLLALVIVISTMVYAAVGPEIRKMLFDQNVLGLILVGAILYVYILFALLMFYILISKLRK